MQIASLTRKAEKMPDVAVPAHNRIIGLFACSTTHVVAIAKKPDRRRLATMIIVPTSNVIASRSIAL